MGLFENLGRKVEKFKQQADEAANSEASHVCENCGESLFSPHETCPNCGSEAVVERERDDGDTPAEEPDPTDG